MKTKLFKRVRVWNEVSEVREVIAGFIYFFGLGLGINTKSNIQVLISIIILLFAFGLFNIKTYKIRYKEVKK